MFCEEVASIVDGYKEKHSEKMNFEIVPTTTERGKEGPEKYELGSHGMVILGPDGEQVLWKKKGHKIEKDDVQNGIDTALN